MREVAMVLHYILQPYWIVLVSGYSSVQKCPRHFHLKLEADKVKERGIVDLFLVPYCMHGKDNPFAQYSRGVCQSPHRQLAISIRKDKFCCSYLKINCYVHNISRVTIGIWSF